MLAKAELGALGGLVVVAVAVDDRVRWQPGAGVVAAARADREPVAALFALLLLLMML